MRYFIRFSAGHHVVISGPIDTLLDAIDRAANCLKYALDGAFASIHPDDKCGHTVASLTRHAGEITLRSELGAAIMTGRAGV